MAVSHLFLIRCFIKIGPQSAQDIQRYAKIYKIPSGGGSAPPGPAPAPGISLLTLTKST